MNAFILGHWEKLISKVVGSRTPRRRWVFVFIEKHWTYSWRLRPSHLSRCVLKQKPTCARINHAVAAHSCTSLWLVFWRAGRAFWRGKYPNWTVICLFFCLCTNVHINDDNCHHLMGRVTLPNSKPSAYVKWAAGSESSGADVSDVQLGDQRQTLWADTTGRSLGCQNSNSSSRLIQHNCVCLLRGAVWARVALLFMCSGSAAVTTWRVLFSSWKWMSVCRKRQIHS